MLVLTWLCPRCRLVRAGSRPRSGLAGRVTDRRSRAKTLIIRCAHLSKRPVRSCRAGRAALRRGPGAVRCRCGGLRLTTQRAARGGPKACGVASVRKPEIRKLAGRDADGTTTARDRVTTVRS